MLFTSWRNEEYDLLNECNSFYESYQKMEDIILGNQQKYEKIDQQLLETAVTNYSEDLESSIRDPVLPQVDHQELIDSSEGYRSSRTYGCFDPSANKVSNSCEQPCSYDLGQDIGITRKQVDESCLPQNEMSDEAFRTLAQNLNHKQKEFFYHVYHWLKTQNDPLYVFLSGGAGVGKSVVLRVLYQALLKYYNHRPEENPDNFKILLCAPTGKAAHNIGGNTIHNTFSIPVGKGFKFKPLDMQQLDTMRCKNHYVKVIFIDEIFMVGSGMFSFINLRLQEIRGCTKPFGGISVVAVGDLFQLKPVMDSWIFTQRVDGLQVLGTNLWKDLFHFYELEEIMRQRDDLEFAQLLNRLREGKHKIPEDIEKLKSRITAKEELSVSAQKLPHLYTTRAASSEHNMEVLESVSEVQKTTVEAIDSISGEISIDLRKRILDKLPDDPSKTMGLQKNLQVGVGVQYELCVNINVEDGMTNGSPCIVQMLDFRVKFLKMQHHLGEV